MTTASDKPSRPIVIVIAAAFAVVLCLALLFMLPLDLFDCAVTVHSRTPSPNSKVAAVVFEKDCGATTDFSTQLSVLARGKDPGSRNSDAAFVVGGRHELGVRWISDDRLLVVVPKGERVYRDEGVTSGGISLEYRRQ